MACEEGGKKKLKRILGSTLDIICIKTNILIFISVLGFKLLIIEFAIRIGIGILGKEYWEGNELDSTLIHLITLFSKH